MSRSSPSPSPGRRARWSQLAAEGTARGSPQSSLAPELDRRPSLRRMIGALGILLSLGLLMYVAYRGLNVLLAAPLLALLATVIGGDTRLLATLTQIYMKSLGGFVTGYFALF